MGMVTARRACEAVEQHPEDNCALREEILKGLRAVASWLENEMK